MIGWVGLGEIGAPMAVRVAERFGVLAYDLAALDRNRIGTVSLGTIAEIAERCEIVCLSLPSPEASNSVVETLCSEAKKVIRLIIELSTIGPVAAKQGWTIANAAGVEYLDAPVSGGVARARSGELTVMHAGSASARELAVEVLEQLQSASFLVGEEPGMGQVMKLINNVISATSLAITSEGIAHGAQWGLDMHRMVDVLNASSGRTSASEDKFPQSILTGAFAFGAKGETLQKDLLLYLQSANTAGVFADLARSTTEVWREFVEHSPGSDVTAIYTFLRDRLP